MQIKCEKCGIVVEHPMQRGPRRRFCDTCNRNKKADYYHNWYSLNGRNRSGGYAIQVMEWRRKNPKKVYAHKQVANALRSGKLINPQQCSECGKNTSYLDAHHDDYRRPLEVRWLCISCHRKVHNNKN